MRAPSRPSMIALVIGAAFLATAAVARAETCTLEIKRLSAQDPSHRVFDPMDYIYRATQPQHFFVQAQPDGKGGVRYYTDDRQTATFQKIVKKEPKYACERPVRYVAKLGGQEFAFALDSSTKPQSDDAEANDKAAKQKDAKKEAKDADSAVAKLRDRLLAAKVSAKPLPRITYDRLYFDFNRNGDLTDDKLVEGTAEWHNYNPPPGQGQPKMWFGQLRFPRLDVALSVDGKPIECCFFFSGHMQVSSSHSHTSFQLNAGAYREGDITLAGKKRRAVLIDFNSNGLFNDVIKIRQGVQGRNKEVYPEQGDMLLLDPTAPTAGRYESPYDPSSSGYRHNVSKLVNIDGQFYELKITPAGDTLTLTPSKAAMGSLTNPNDGYRATIYGDQGFLQISGNKGTPVAVPEGQWKLLSYTITLPETPPPAEPPKDKPAAVPAPEVPDPEPSLLGMLFKKVESILGPLAPAAVPRPVRRGPRISYVNARATSDYKPVKVVKGKTVELPFGPPYKPVVKAWNYSGSQPPDQLHLELSLVGSSGETCSNMMVDGDRPGKPRYTITDDKDKVVEQGSFEYG